MCEGGIKTGRQRQINRETETYRDRQRQAETDGGRNTKTERQSQRYIELQRQRWIERQRGMGGTWEGQRERVTGKDTWATH